MRFILVCQAGGVDGNGDDVVSSWHGLGNAAVQDEETQYLVVGLGLEKGELANDFVGVRAACGVCEEGVMISGFIDGEQEKGR